MLKKTWGRTTTTMYKQTHRFDSLKTNCRLFAGLGIIVIVSILFAWNEYRLQLVRNLYEYQISDAKFFCQIARREMGEQVFNYLENEKKNYQCR